MENSRSKFDGWLDSTKALFSPHQIRPVSTALFVGFIIWFFGTIIVITTVSQPYEGVTFWAMGRAFPASFVMALAIYLVGLIFRMLQLKFSKYQAVFYFTSPAVVAFVVLIIRQSLPATNLLPQAWELLGNQAMFWVFGYVFSFGFQQVIGIATARVESEAQRANKALRQLEQQHLLLLDAQEQVRKELARYLHDGLQSNLVVLGLQMQNAISNLPEETKAMGQSFLEEIERIRGVDVRGAIKQLSPDLEGLSLAGALRELIAKYLKSMKVSLDMDSASSSPALDEKIKLAAYRVIEQGLLNAAVHGRASEVSITCIVQDSAMSLTVINNGEPLVENYSLGVGLSVVDGWCKVFAGNWQLFSRGETTSLKVRLSLWPSVSPIQMYVFPPLGGH